ncbi:Transcription regulator [contains diacylglycerol kinase catalytic domain] [Citrobacter freundii]|uniref:Transcription regulator [contains diacylglycerol kinase catalytic domain] n=1 Tax=Citrobacter freundii TaxID=546 RepID=A0A7G2IP10_CITFR|nr:Transcription regulator [contains diacylglycerol kinase catalytic domain] [Citrobacter freundii]
MEKSADNLPLRDAIAKLRDEGVEIHVRVTWEKRRCPTLR